MNNRNEQKIDEILSSLDGVKRAEAPAFFYTRLKAKMEKASPETSRPWLFRPVFALAALLIVLLINAAVILKKDNTAAPNADTENESFQSIAAEYNLNEVVSLTDLNQEK